MNRILGLSLVLISSLAIADTPAPAKQPVPAKPPAGAAAVRAEPPPPDVSGACFELSADGKAWSRTPERLCVGSGDKNVELKLETGMPTPTTVAVFHLDLTTRVRCIDCNKDVFSLSNPSNSVFNALKVSFAGKRDVKAGTETGTLTIGKNKFFYRKTK